MDNSVLQKLYLGDKFQCLENIFETYKQKGYAIINYLYFANAMKYRLFENRFTKLQTNYYNSMIQGDFILPDGIALQVFYHYYSKISKDLIKKWPQNLNGTDFAPFLLQNISKYGKVNLILYGAKAEVLDRAVSYIQEKFGTNVFYAQNGYEEFDFEKLEDKIVEKYGSIENNKDINIFFIGRGTPLQENWIYSNVENLKKYHLMTFSQGGTFDFWGGVEKRAPGLLVKLRVFETFWRIITNPKKNLPKFLSMFGIFRVIVKIIISILTNKRLG